MTRAKKILLQFYTEKSVTYFGLLKQSTFNQGKVNDTFGTHRP